MVKDVLSRQIFKAKRVQKESFILEYCKDKNVLDVGCLGQDYSFLSPSWLHGKIRNVAKSITGVDILDELIANAKNQGFNIIHESELKATQDKFDVVVLADVIEHVDDPVKLLNSYATHLAPKGKMIVTTPNAKRVFDFIHILFSNKYWLNPEHTMWLCPLTMLEIIRRADLSVHDFYWLKNYQITTTWFSKAGVLSFISGLFRFRKAFSPNFMFILSKESIS